MKEQTKLYEGRTAGHLGRASELVLENEVIDRGFARTIKYPVMNSLHGRC